MDAALSIRKAATLSGDLVPRLRPVEQPCVRVDDGAARVVATPVSRAPDPPPAAAEPTATPFTAPRHTAMAVMAGRLQDFADIRALLAAEDCFALLDEVGAALAESIREHDAIRGPHDGETTLVYFPRRPARSHIADAIRCAIDLRETMSALGRKWQNRVSWMKTLQFNIGLDESSEWLGSYRNGADVALTVPGDAAARARQLSALGRGGAVWVTKAMLDKLTLGERALLRHGIRRRTTDGDTVVVPGLYSAVSDLFARSGAEAAGYDDIGTLSVTEIIDARRTPA